MRKDVLAFVCVCVVTLVVGVGTIVANSQSASDTTSCTACHQPSATPSEMTGNCQQCHNANNQGSTPTMAGDCQACHNAQRPGTLSSMPTLTGSCQQCHNANNQGSTPLMTGSCELCHSASTQKVPTTLSPITAPAFVSSGFTLSGTLKASNGVVLPSTTVKLQRFAATPSNDWSTVQTAVPNADGMYSFAVSDSAGSYQYRVYYEGSSSIQPQTSNVVTVAFVSKAWVADDAKTLLSRMSIDSSSFSTNSNYKAYTNKLNALAQTISAGNYADAQTKISNDLMRKTDGCGSSAKQPDKDDWIITCQAQDKVYPRLQTILQEIKAL